MVPWKRNNPSVIEAANSSDNNSDTEKNGHYLHSSESPDVAVGDQGQLSDPNDANNSLHRGLQARQVSMIAIGGAIGTGLIIGTGTALSTSGPAPIVISCKLRQTSLPRVLSIH
jgi:amino acid transporter